MFCRLCVFDFDEYNTIAIFNDGEESDVSKLILKYLHLEIAQNDNFSTNICLKCYNQLKECNDFLTNILERQEVLKTQFLELQTQSCLKPIENCEESLIDIKDVCPKIEFNNEASDEQSCGNDAENEFDKSEDNLSILDLKDKISIAKSKTTNVKSFIKSKLHRKKRKIEKTRKSPKERIRNKTQGIVKKSKKDTKNILSLEDEKKNDELIERLVPLKCEICGDISETLKNFRSHFQSMHKQKAYIICCGKRLKQRCRILDHIKMHINPEHFKCEICHKVLKTHISLMTHTNIYHKDKSLLKHACDTCGKQFAYLSMLKNHMTVHKDDKNNICEICQKGFKSISSLNGHIQHMHKESTIYICDICGKKYRFKPSFDRHVAEHQGTFKVAKRQCPICKVWVSFTYIRRHIQRHQKVDVDCEICGQKFNSLPALINHKEKKHKHRKIYDCQYCDKKFFSLQCLKEHVDMHTGHKEYSCKYCPREFRSKANMYAHAKKAHQKEWAEAQLERAQGPSIETTANESNSEVKTINDCVE